MGAERGMAPTAGRAPARKVRKAETVGAILDGALVAFSRHGYRGTTVDEIATRAGMSKPNLLYYFRSKEEIYRAVLGRTLEEWLRPLEGLDPHGDPIEELSRYVAAKLELSQSNPEASRLFANEILQGAPHLLGVLQGPLKALVDRKAETIGSWIEKGLIARIDPHHLIFMIWAMTQHYADFDVQIRAILGAKGAGETLFASARATVAQLVAEGLRPR
jgi:TetR/AcrR family transcriptional regulator